MIIVTRKNITKEDRIRIEKRLTDLGFKLHPIIGVEKIVIGAIGDKRSLDIRSLESLPGVEQVIPILHPYKLASREGRPEGSRIDVGGVSLGGGTLAVMAGPCAVESREQLLEAATGIARAGGHALRGGAFKPRTSPYSFQGLQEEGLMLLAEARAQTGLPIITEVLNLPELDMVAGVADILQIGARNMQNFGLLRAVGQLRQRAAQTGAIGDGRGVADVGGVYLGRGQRASHPVRAGNQDVRDRHAQHAGPGGGGSGQDPDPSARHRRPQPRYGQTFPGRPHGPGGGDGRRRWIVD